VYLCFSLFSLFLIFPSLPNNTTISFLPPILLWNTSYPLHMMKILLFQTARAVFPALRQCHKKKLLWLGFQKVMGFMTLSREGLFVGWACSGPKRRFCPFTETHVQMPFPRHGWSRFMFMRGRWRSFVKGMPMWNMLGMELVVKLM